jgi:hypothetical protein
MSEYDQSVFISYAWRGESEAVVNQIDETLQQRGLTIIRDKRNLGYKSSISAFMGRIGQGNCIIVVISDKYLRSPNCMFELVEIAEGKQFYDRVFPIILSNAEIYDPVKRLGYVKYWEDKLAELDQAMKEVRQANLQGIREEIDQYSRIRDKVSGLTSILKDMNTLTPDMHKDSDFSEIYTGIEQRMMGAGRRENRSVDIQNPNDKLLTSSALKFQVKQDFIKELQHIDFIKQNKSYVSLEEIFVFPSLSKSKDAFEKEDLDIEYFLQKKEDMTIIKGSDSSGKTALLNWLFLKLSENNSPVFIDASEIVKINNSRQLIKNTFQKEYDGSFDDWMLLENKIAIIDNYHHNLPIAFLNFLSANFSMVIVAVDEDEWMAYLKDDPGYAKFTVASINQMSLAKQEELIKNWKMLDLGDGTTSVDDLTIDKLEATVNNIVTRNRIVPRYPFYILSILQTFESFMPKDYSITAYGHCYQALVVAQMMKKGIKGEQIDDCFNFLRHLAFDIYQKKTEGEIYTAKDYLNFKQKYGERFFIQSSLLNRLENNEYEIIKIGERVNFTLDYTYYFFVGMYLAFADDQDGLLSKLIEDIHLKQNALIVIFTVHHTQNKAILENILAHCVCCFDDVKAAELTVDETQFMNELIAELPADIVSKKSVGETRKEIRERQDREHDDSDREDKEAEEVKAIDINKGLRILEVLGQILKNRGGSFERDIVLETLESTIDLGLRILNLLLDSFRTPEFSEWLSKSLEDFEREYISEHRRSFSDEKRKKFVAKTIQIMGYMLTVSMLNRISFSVNSEKLMEAIGILSDKKKTPAYQMIGFLTKLSQNGLETQELKQLIASFDKNKNFWAKKTISYYAQGYLSTHNIKFKERQKIYSLLEIDYVPNKKLS